MSRVVLYDNRESANANMGRLVAQFGRHDRPLDADGRYPMERHHC